MQHANTTTCVRVAFKAFEIGVPFEFGTGGGPTDCTLAKIQKKKIDEMEMWENNPFVHYNIKIIITI